MNRRQFLIHLGQTSLLLVLPGVSGCGSSSALTGLTVASTADGTGHQHSFTISADALANPGSGISASTTLDSGHTHTVSLSNGELTNINNGDLVTKTASTASGHNHSFAFTLS